MLVTNTKLKNYVNLHKRFLNSHIYLSERGIVEFENFMNLILDDSIQFLEEFDSFKQFDSSCWKIRFDSFW